MSTTTSFASDTSLDFHEEYARWKAVGIGGVSADWEGFMFVKNLETTGASSDTLTPDVYSHPEKYTKGWDRATDTQRATAHKAFLKEALPTRAAPRSRAMHFVIPQRERNADDPHDPIIEDLYQAMFDTLRDSNSDTEYKTSVLEKRGKALFTNQRVTLNPVVEQTQREICHIHASDLSGHVTLSFADAMEVIGKGWGERHRMSGTERLPLGYTMLYIPRSEAEVATFAKIFQAGIEFMKSG